MLTLIVVTMIRCDVIRFLWLHWITRVVGEVLCGIKSVIVIDDMMEGSASDKYLLLKITALDVHF